MLGQTDEAVQRKISNQSYARELANVNGPKRQSFAEGGTKHLFCTSLWKRAGQGKPSSSAYGSKNVAKPEKNPQNLVICK